MIHNIQLCFPYFNNYQPPPPPELHPASTAKQLAVQLFLWQSLTRSLSLSFFCLKAFCMRSFQGMVNSGTLSTLTRKMLGHSMILMTCFRNLHLPILFSVLELASLFGLGFSPALMKFWRCSSCSRDGTADRLPPMVPLFLQSFQAAA